ncbi:ABC-2 family transporter protein [Fodinisporobacter ferrooxydans]|uniref:ABC-2 family transporter protein n=1 Tax=Fodinisporobacter ferrooxydans TaxID=2901836 RepID=A0ABY4CG28_9BACL|nr:ABC-2 family transporter protein [Alicyclobacillaceae bacterium MYW30-H2]
MTRRLRMYLEFSRKSFQRSAVYRFDAWTRLFANIIFLFMWGFIWYGLYAGKLTTSGTSFHTMLSYILISQALSGLHGAATPLWEIQERVRTGDIAMEIVRPFDYPLKVLFSDFGSMFFYFLVAILPLYASLGFFFHPVMPHTASGWLLFLLSAFLGYLIRYSIELTFGLFTFWLVETGGVEDIFYFSVSLLSGTTVPLWFFPHWLRVLAEWLPFQGIFFVPDSIFVGLLSRQQAFQQILLQILWICITYGILRFVWRRAVTKVVVQGG